MKIYTKAGDKGQTSLFGGKKVSKSDLQIEAYGTVDELNSFIGVLISQINENALDKQLKSIQPILFDIGSHLASDGTASQYLPELKTDLIQKMEEQIDQMTASLAPLKSFIMPGGSASISAAHVCRTVCRRAERRVVHLSEATSIPDFIPIYLNRLSDYFFVVARYLAHLEGVDEVKWNA